MSKCTIRITKFIWTGCCLSFYITFYMLPIRTCFKWKTSKQTTNFIRKPNRILIGNLKMTEFWLISYHTECSIYKTMLFLRNHMHLIFDQSNVTRPCDKHFQVNLQINYQSTELIRDFWLFFIHFWCLQAERNLHLNS